MSFLRKEYSDFYYFRMFPAIAMKESNNGFQKHMIRLRQNGDNHQLIVNELIPEIVLVNAHNAYSCFMLDAGIYRCVCDNQLTIGDSTIATRRKYFVEYFQHYTRKVFKGWKVFGQ